MLIRYYKQSGGILTTALAVVALIGTISYTAYSILSGPVRTSSLITLRTKAQNDMMIGAKLLMRSGVDSDADNVIELPAPDITVTYNGGANNINSETNGGGIPATNGAEKIDPWNVSYAYCTWNNGSNNAASPEILEGVTTAYEPLNFIVLISAGPNRIFETVCKNAGAINTNSDGGGYDDIVVRYTYEQATNIELWKDSAGGVGLETSTAGKNIGIGKAADATLKLDVLGDSRLVGNVTVNTGTLTAATVDLNSGTIDGVTINGSPIGGSSASTGSFTSLSSSLGTTTTGLTATGLLTLTGTSGTSNINNVQIGSTTPAAARFTNLVWTGTLTPPNTTVVTNLNADLLDGQHGSFYQNATNLNAGTVNKARLPAFIGDVSKVAGDDYTYIEAIQGYTVDMTGIGANTVLGWDNTNSLWKPMTVTTGSGSASNIGVSGVNFLATDTGITSANCSSGQIPKYNGTDWDCAADGGGGPASGATLTLPIYADNATSPAGQIISINANADNFLRYSGGNLYLGEQAGEVATGTATNNTFIGMLSGITNAVGQGNTFLGYRAGNLNNATFNTFIGSDAGRVNSSGTNNVFVGRQAGVANTIGSRNVFLGVLAGGANTTQNDNIHIGDSAGASAAGDANIFIGTDAGRNFTTSGSIAIGYQAAQSNTSGSFNNVIGYQAARFNQTGVRNVIMGYQAAQGSALPTNVSDSVIIGYRAGADNNSGSIDSAVFVGYEAGLNNRGIENVFLGYQAGRTNTTGTSNVYLGHSAGLNFNSSANTMVGVQAGLGVAGSSTGIRQTLVGYQAGRVITSGAENVMMGYQAGLLTSTGQNNTILGSGAGQRNASNNTFIGYQAGANFTGGTNTFVGSGTGVGVAGTSTGTGNILLGANVGAGLLNGSNNFIAGNVDTASSLTSGSDNVIIGRAAGSSYNAGGTVRIGVEAGRYSTGAANLYIGAYSGVGVAGSSSGGSNLAIGESSAQSLTTGDNSTYIGYYSGRLVSIGRRNVYVGSNSGEASNNNDNTYIGSNAGRYLSGAQNTIVGSGAGTGVNGTSTSSNNTLIGFNAGTALTTGGSNIIIGNNSGTTLLTGTGNILIGVGAQTPANNTSNYLLIFGNGGDAIRGTINSGNLSAQGAAWAFHSDKRLKKDIHTIQNPLEKLLQVRGVTYKWNGITNKDTTSTNYGVIAQEVQKLFPDLVTESVKTADGKKYLEVKYTEFIPLLIESLKEQQQEIVDRKQKISKIENEIQSLEVLLADIKQKKVSNAR